MFLLAILPVFYVLLLLFVIGSFYYTICINILLLFCLFTSSSIAVGPRIDALRPLEELILGVLAATKAPSTVKGYHSQFQKWKAWAASFPGVSCFPASALHVSLYLISLIQSGYSFATRLIPPFIVLIFFIIRVMSRIHVTVVLLKPFWKAARESLLLFVSSKKRLPICPENLHVLVLRFAGVNASLPDIRDFCLCLVSFAGLLRFNEACNIRCCDIDFKDTYFSLHIPRSKTDQYGSGSTRVVARTGNPTCPFNMLRRYAHLSGDSFNST